ncbi:MAG: YaiO family outer membrane beta-barrel protein [Fimbriimonadaceae bacterium]|nr:YaiO family outer membrane beta-barrel protein [Fimbriimonadaceae bacterium]
MKRIGRYGILTMALAASLASAQDQKATGYVEVGGGASKVTNGQGDWSGAYLRGSYGFPKKDIVNFEVRSAKRFKDDGFYLGFLWTHYVQPDVYTSFGVGTSTGGFFFPKVRVDGSVSKIWGAKQDVVTTVGATYNQARDTYYDWAGFFDLTYYVANVVLQLGTRYNVSYPGSAKSWSGYGAISIVKAKDYMLTFRYGGGRESYLPLGGTLVPVDFSSTTYSVGLRKWLNNDWGFNATYEWYTNPNYKRNGFELGVFRDF